MRPALPLLTYVALLLVLSIVGAFSSTVLKLWGAFSILLAILALLDAIRLRRTRPPEAKRNLPARFALGVPDSVGLHLKNPNRLPLHLTLQDALPPQAETADLPWTGTLPGRGETLDLHYDVTLLRRGKQTFQHCHCLLSSPFRLWQREVSVGAPTSTRVYPNYEPVIRYSLLATANRESQMGIRHRNRPGNSKEFHQLRDYQDGDTLQQIDWNATSRRNTLISREYREQRDQNIIFLIDSGRRMRAMDGDLSQFDHSLNALLLVSYIALRQGDKVGVQAFGGNDRWLPPVRGTAAMTTILNHVYDYQTSLAPGDIREATQTLMARQRRRSLVVVLTNLRGEDADDLVPSLRTLQRRHVVLLANLRERLVEDQLNTPVQTFDDALANAATNLYTAERVGLLTSLRAQGIYAVDTTARTLPIELTNTVLDIKKSGRL